MSILARIEKAIAKWLRARELHRLMLEHGGIQWCPWCKQCVQLYDGSYFDSKTDPTIDALHCGNCGGVSRWRFEFGMLPLDPIGLAPPPVKCVHAEFQTGSDLKTWGHESHVSWGSPPKETTSERNDS